MTTVSSFSIIFTIDKSLWCHCKFLNEKPDRMQENVVILLIKVGPLVADRRERPGAFIYNHVWERLSARYFLSTKLNFCVQVS